MTEKIFRKIGKPKKKKIKSIPNMHTYMQTYTYTYIHSYTYTYMHSYVSYLKCNLTYVIHYNK